MIDFMTRDEIIIKIEHLCPYCHKSVLDGKHTVSNFKFYQMVGCPKYPKNQSPIFINKKLWVRNA